MDFDLVGQLLSLISVCLRSVGSFLSLVGSFLARCGLALALILRDTLLGALEPRLNSALTGGRSLVSLNPSPTPIPRSLVAVACHEASD